ncbi:LysR family transcriptional regulator [Asanoa sp. WMMD1127]|uniref:LysR substrate-binding domain-containing protein n=1 Tax=Asanoa sp. WMMD1127 TaxID=3016107 RepID=UPI002417DC37|nr:LysR family transcriptional regulator [Asanoa sp. WMMD1127]MDG4820818.1 LysR family transcriptional regulator [Asanoa sp. WMMD1127]
MIELRDIEIFLTLAEELHFARTAERLRISPARVSQSIAKQERRIGGVLFERTTRAVRLSPLGEQLHREVSGGYRQIIEGFDTVSAAATGISGTLTLGAMGPQPTMISHVVEQFQSRHPAARLRYQEIQPTAPLHALRSGEIDIALVWLPVHEPEISVGPVTHSSPLMLMVNASHPLAGRDTVCLEDLGDCVVLTGTDVPASMEQTFNPFHTPSGRPIRRGPKVSGWHEELSVIAAGQAVTVVASEAARFYPWPNITYVPVRDAEPCRWALVWRTTAETPLIRAMVVAAEHATGAQAPDGQRR